MDINNYIKSDKKEEISFDIFNEDNANSEQLHFSKSTSYIDFRKELNNQQLNVIDEIKGPQLIIAGAGSGKTRTIVYCVAKLLSDTVKPSEIMLVTFTNKAASEMIKRVEDLLGIKPKGIWAGTFHSIANRFLRQYAKSLGFKPNYVIIDETDANLLMKITYNAIEIQTDDISFPSPKTAKKILAYSINCNKTISETIKWKYKQYDDIKIISKLKEIYTLYKNKKAKDNLVDFDDLLIFWNRLLDERFMAQRIASTFNYILVDEYQDTNYIQDEIIRKLSKYTPESNILAVGDDAQSIYGFRGANFQNIMEFSKRFENCRIYKLTQNYRSVPEILDLANDSIKHNKSQFRKKMETTRKEGVKPIHIISENDEQQAIFIVNKLLELQRDGYKTNDMAVLYRAGFHSLRIELELQNRNIPYVVHSGVSFFERAHVKDLLAHLRIIQNQGDEISWSRIFSQFQGIGKKTASKIFDLLSNMDNPLDKIISSNLFINKMRNLRISKVVQEEVTLYLKEFLKSVKNDKPKVVIIKLINQLIKFLKPQYSNWQDRVEDLKQIGIYSQNYDTIQSFLDTLTLNKSTIESKTVGLSNNKIHSPVTLSTVHRAKGLEWKIVFIPMLSENLFPSNRVKINTDAYEEERRVFYVGITRAKEQLYLLSPRKIKSFKGQKDLNLSQFINELNPKVYRRLSYQEYLSSLEETTSRSLGKGKVKKTKHLPLFTTADSLLKD
ncbi:MAG: ATP-dependent helicase [Candidatus Lokiarchaeota archaeon]|nr:ATP-dependent helicase [Candidatus Lokiarchaeota archaeon]